MTLPVSGRIYPRACRENPDHCGTGSQAIPLKMYRDFWVVTEGRLGRSPEPQNFVLDTGTAPSIINMKLVTQLGLTTTPSTIFAVGKSIPAQAADIPQIELGPILVTSFPALVRDLSQLEHDMGIPIAAIIGMDVLSKSSFRLDYDRREIEFGEVSYQGIPVHFDVQAGLAVADVKLGSKALRMLVDTGTDRVVLLGGNFAEVGWLELSDTSQSGTSVGERGLRVQVFSASDITLGGQHFNADRAYFIPGAADPAFDGLLGVRALGFRAFSYDRPNETVYLQR